MNQFKKDGSVSIPDPNPKPNPNNENAIPCAEAAEWTKAWRDKYQNKEKPVVNPTSAYLVPVVDLIEVLNEMGVLSDKVAEKAQGQACVKGLKIRAYMAIGSEDADEELEEKLLVVGTKYNKRTKIYEDIINEEVDGDKGKLSAFGTPITSSGIYDFTDPCPPSCDPYSPLN